VRTGVMGGVEVGGVEDGIAKEYYRAGIRV
jgi:hypothetical protein